MFIKMYDTLLNSQHILRVHPPFSRRTQSNAIEWVIQMELIVPQTIQTPMGVQMGNVVETREYKYLEEVEAKEVMKNLTETLVPMSVSEFLEMEEGFIEAVDKDPKGDLQ